MAWERKQRRVCLLLRLLKKKSYLVLEEVVPCPAAEHKSDEELDQVQREVEHDAVEPDDTSPAPADTLDPGEAPVGVDSEEGRNLHQ